jgi:hypothetical protein
MASRFLVPQVPITSPIDKVIEKPFFPRGRERFQSIFDSQVPDNWSSFLSSLSHPQGPARSLSSAPYSWVQDPASTSIRANSDSVSNDIDESNWQYEKQYEQRI